jgi:ribonuclease HI
MYQIYADGACQPNPGECGSGVVVYKDGQLVRLFYGNYRPMATNNVAELVALEYGIKLAIKAIKHGESKVEVFSDSQYAIKCMIEWIDGWLKSDWKKGKVKNQDIIKPMYEMFKPYKDNIIINHVYGHSGIEGNELADRMAVEAVSAKQVEFVSFGMHLSIPEILQMKSY